MNLTSLYVTPLKAAIRLIALKLTKFSLSLSLSLSQLPRQQPIDLTIPFVLTNEAQHYHNEPSQQLICTIINQLLSTARIVIDPHHRQIERPTFDCNTIDRNAHCQPGVMLLHSETERALHAVCR